MDQSKKYSKGIIINKATTKQIGAITTYVMDWKYNNAPHAEGSFSVPDPGHTLSSSKIKALPKSSGGKNGK